ncbi:MAG TPA: permease-like cell division protein FtsX [Candidatus Saccharimonadales bacterium]|nr:permease-like cell division protein FtsX [Candidatus Saccharimonadales bacterium]
MKRKFITFARILKTGMINFVRNAWLGIAAIAVMVVTLTIVLFSILTNATFNHTIDQIRDKIDISMYLSDEITAEQRDQMLAELKALPNVAAVTYLSKDQALERYKEQNANNPELLSAISQTDNPLPATVQIKPKDLNKISEIKDFLSNPEKEALQSEEPSYSGDRKEAIDKITHATNTLQRAGLVAVVVFAVISMLIIFNTIQMAIFNRRDEITIMRLLGASTSYIRGPFVVETIFYGVVSALISVLFIHAAFVAASSALEASSLGLLDIQYSSDYFYDHFWLLLGMQLVIGILIGAISSIVATKRYLKFKAPK